MSYTLGEAARMLNVAKSTIRNYEKHGLLTAQRNENNDYRTFSDEEIFVLRQIRAFRALDFSVEEIAVLLGGSERTQMMAMLRDKRVALTREAEMILQRLRKMEKVEDKLINSCVDGTIHLVRQPAMDWLPITAENRDVQSAWTEQMPYTFIAPLISSVDTAYNVRVGIGVDAEDMERLRLPRGDALHLSAPQELCMTVCTESNQFQAYRDKIHVLSQYAACHHLNKTGDVLVQGLITLTDDEGKKGYYVRLHMPLTA